MLVKVRTGYGYRKGTHDYKPGETVDLTEEEYMKKHWIFELVVEKKEVPAPRKEEAKAEEPVLENRAVLDSQAGAPILRRGGRKK